MKQDRALEIMLTGANVMLTGQAGAGKSYVINKFVEAVKRKRKHVVVTATTGLAATQIGGQTIHSWSGIGLDKYLHEDYIYTLSETRKKAMRKTDILIIDEISMMHDYNLDMIDKAMKIVRENDEPMGGLQLILVGDFFQLPPVMQGGNGHFVTESEAWDKLDLKVCYLEESYRTEDPRLQDVLNAMRDGSLSQKHVDIMKERIGVQPVGKVTRLYTTNADVERINNERLNALEGDTRFFLRTSTGRSYTDLVKLQKNVLAPEVLRLKTYAMVMAVKNDTELRYANGSIGVIEGWTREGFPIVDFGGRDAVTVYPEQWEYKRQDRVTATITQIPLRLAYAITVHKSQGMTLDAAEMDLTNTFVAGMGYVALSRVKSLDNLYLKGLSRNTFAVSTKAREIDNKLRKQSRELI